MQKLEAPEQTVLVEDDRTAISVEALKRAILDNLFYIVGATLEAASDEEFFTALAYTVRDRILARWFATVDCYKKHDVRVVCYLSAEFLMGPHLANNLLNLDIEAPVRQAVTELGRDLDRIEEQEPEPGLGNGGLGRLAACYLDSLATLGVPAIGYGIRYQFGIFQQQIQDGWQVELTDYWLRYGNPWEIRRPNEGVEVGFGGHTESWTDANGKYRVRWVPTSVVRGIPYDTAILGYRSGIANDLRLWRSESTESFYFERFNSGDYSGAVAGKTFAENISKVLYPNDEEIQGKELRLQPQHRERSHTPGTHSIPLLTLKRRADREMSCLELYQRKRGRKSQPSTMRWPYAPDGPIQGTKLLRSFNRTRSASEQGDFFVGNSPGFVYSQPWISRRFWAFPLPVRSLIPWIADFS